MTPKAAEVVACSTCVASGTYAINGSAHASCPVISQGVCMCDLNPAVCSAWRMITFAWVPLLAVARILHGDDRTYSPLDLAVHSDGHRAVPCVAHNELTTALFHAVGL